MKIIKNKTHYSLNKISKMFGLAGANTSLNNFLIENVPYIYIEGKQFFDKEIIDDLYSNHSKYGLKSTKIENCYFFYKEGSIADDYISNYFTISQLKQKYMELQGQELMVYTFEKLGININQYPIEQVSLAGRTYNFIPNMYLDEILNKIIIKQKLDATNNPYEKYEIRTSFIPELQQYKFKKTLQYVKEYIYFALSKNKKQKIITHNILEIQDFLINNLDKEIDKYSNDEIFEVILKMDCSGSVKNTFFKFLNFLSQKSDVLFDTKFGVKNEPKVKQISDFYSIDEWERYINYIFDIDKHIEKAFSNYKYARYWLFLMLQCNLAWRLSDFLIPDDVNSIGDLAFSDCDELTSVTISDSVTSIGEDTFAGCTSLSDLVVPSSVTTISSNAFFSVPHVTYGGTAEGSPWGALVVNDDSHVHNYVSEVTKEASCVEDGVKTFTCRCGDSYTQVIPALGHSYGEWETVSSPNCTNSGSKQRVCDVCGYVDTDELTALGHNWESTYTVDKAATCTEAGSKSQHCTRCSAKQNVTSIAATGHKYGTPTYTWSTDGKSCTATRVCANNSSHKETENATITSAVKTAATCTAKGTTTYTAKFKNSAFATQTKDVQDINALGHNYASAYTIDKNATCTEAGSKSQHCSRCSAKQNVTSIPATGHNYVNDRCTLCGKSLYGEDVTLTSDNLATYGIAKEGVVTIPSVVTDTKGIKHKVTSIGNNAFRGCRGLYEITIPESVTSIGSYAFYNTILSGVTYKGQHYFRLSELTNALISNGVSVGSNVFNSTKLQ